MKSLLLLLVVLCLSSQFILHACGYSTKEASASTNCSTLLARLQIPAEIAVPSGQKLHLVYYAKGLQHYVFNGSAWVNFNATAPLYPVTEKKDGGFGHKRHPVGEHFFLGHPDAKGGQPSWKTWVPAFSLVTARSLHSVTVDPHSITWNLLEATSTSGSTDLLGAVTYVQRVASKGGLPPSTTVGAKVGQIHVTPYSILYIFYVNAS